MTDPSISRVSQKYKNIIKSFHVNYYNLDFERKRNGFIMTSVDFFYLLIFLIAFKCIKYIYITDILQKKISIFFTMT